MTLQSPLKTAFHGLRRLFRSLARPVRRTRRQGGFVIEAYRGYGHGDRVLLMGRVLKQPAAGLGGRAGGLAGDLMNIGRRFVRYGIANASVMARAGGREHRVEADRDGYFTVDMRVPPGAFGDGIWQSIDLELLEPPSTGVHARAQVLIPPKTCRFVVISDIDDTVMYTGVANKLKMLWRLFVKTAESRLAFPGVGAFYRALHDGASGSEQNPMLYVSRAPWGIYEVLEDFFNLHKIPIGPVLFLREWGVTLQHPLPKKSKGHKRALIDDMLAIYDDLPFVLIGDSGQRDPEIYSAVVREHASRVLAVYIRNVSRDPERAHAIETLAKQVAAAGSALVLAGDSHAMAIHAVERGLIAPSVLQAVHQEQRDAGETPDRGTPRPVRAPTPAAAGRDAKASVEAGRGERSGGASAERPASIVVEPGERSPEDARS